MPTNKNLTDRIDKIEAQLRIKPIDAPEETQWLQTAWMWITTNKVVSGFLALLLALIGAWFSYWLNHKDEVFNRAVDYRIDQILKSPGGVSQTLSKIQETTTSTDSSLRTLTPFIQDLVKHQFENTSKLSAATFQKRLPAIRDLLAVAKDQKVKVEPTVTAALGKQLLKVPSGSNDFWAVAGDFISYRSFITVSWAPSENLPNCTDSQPTITTVTQPFTLEGQPHELRHNLGEYRNCRVTLDSPTDGERLRSLLFGSVPNLFFYRCVVVYRGGPVKIPLAWNNRVIDSVTDKKGPAASLSESGNTLTFNDCVFEFSLPQSPPASEGQQLTKSVLSQDTPTIVLPLAKHS